MATNEYLTKEQLDEAICSICDALKTKDIIPELKSSTGLTITTALCDKYGMATSPLVLVYGGVAGVGITTTGFAVSKAAQNVTESIVSSFVEKLITGDKQVIEKTNNETTAINNETY